jgi:hypothetical protein
MTDEIPNKSKHQFITTNELEESYDESDENEMSSTRNMKEVTMTDPTRVHEDEVKLEQNGRYYIVRTIVTFDVDNSEHNIKSTLYSDGQKKRLIHEYNATVSSNSTVELEYYVEQTAKECFRRMHELEQAKTTDISFDLEELTE